jgi:hypothetical protein
MSNVLLFDPSDNATVEISWADVLPAGITLSSVTHAVPSPLVKGAESTDAPNSRSFVKVSGAVHGAVYMIEGQATLSNGDVINRQWPVRGFNS